MKRKLIKQAGQAITLTLPIEWIRENGLKPGDEIDIEESEKDLILRSKNKIIGGKINIKVPSFPRRIKHTYINSAYAKGIDEIELELDKEEYLELNQNIGFAVVSQKGSKYTIRDVSGPSSENMDNLFKRIFQMILNFYDSAIEDIFNKNSGTVDDITKIDKEINKFTLFLQRSIMKLSYAEQSMGKIIFTYSFLLEKIGDEILRLWRTNINSKVNKNKEIKEFVLLSKSAVEKSFALYYRPNVEEFKELITMREQIRKKSEKLLNTNVNTAIFIMHTIRIAEDSYDLIQLSLMKELKPK